MLIAITSGDQQALVAAEQRFPNALILPKPVNIDAVAEQFKQLLVRRPPRKANGSV